MNLLNPIHLMNLMNLMHQILTKQSMNLMQGPTMLSVMQNKIPWVCYFICLEDSKLSRLICLVKNKNIPSIHLHHFPCPGLPSTTAKNTAEIPADVGGGLCHVLMSLTNVQPRLTSYVFTAAVTITNKVYKLDELNRC